MKLFTLLAFLSLIATYSFAQPGSLDLSFNDSGKF
ncbi:hypothetical protein SAMN05444277_11873 [Parafilimonas terrae]|uniref:Uncharacterized protein n=1 Tax=Parafilimonas terrae TaxID=1465490 RepID=A0A1I5ZAY5_9BACT|nr:hypothetical protein SAMN05444277_11873 [Parafilimonas terrae]